MLFATNNYPYPNSETLRRLAEIDPDLTLRWQPVLKRWGLMLRWPRSDSRWQLVQHSQILEEDAFDLLELLPADCSPDEAYAYVVRSFKAWSGSKAEVKALLDRVHMYNKENTQSIKEEALSVGEELLTVSEDKIRVYQYNPPTKSKPLIIAE